MACQSRQARRRSRKEARRATVGRMRAPAFASLRLTTALHAALLLTSLAAMALATPAEARACSCVTGTPEAHFAEATAVFEGRVLSIVRVGEPEVGPARLRVTFEVVQTWKAANAERLVVTTASDGAACGVAFLEGQSYLVYATAGTDGALQAGLCGGTTLREDADAIVATLGAGTTPVDVTDEAPRTPHRATAPGAGGCASCDVGAHAPSPTAPLTLLSTMLLIAMVAHRRS